MFRIAFLTLAVLTAASETRDHPAVKIVALLQRLQAQAKTEGEGEANSYSQFTYWCSETLKEATADLHSAKKWIKVSSATIEALTADIDQLDKQVIELQSSKTAQDAAKTAGTTARGVENTKYIAAKADLENTISAIEAATQAIKDSKPDAFIQAQALLAAHPVLKRHKDKSQKHVFLRRQHDEPETNADKYEDRTGRERNYDFKGGDVLEMLKKLQLNFEDDLTEMKQAETAALNSHSLADATKEDEITATDAMIGVKTTLSGSKGQDKSTQQDDLDIANADFTTATNLLAATKTECSTRADEFAERTERRAGEIKAMQAAIDVLSKVVHVRDPADKLQSFIQLTKKIADPKAAIVNLLRKAGSVKGEAALAKLADKIAALKQTPGSGVFDSIKNMIQKMIFHLMSEQKDEDDHKNWCDREVNQTDKLQEDKASTRDSLDVDIDALDVEIQRLAEGISDNTDDIKLLDTSMTEQSAQRQEEKTENAATIADSQDAQKAVGNAIAILEDFYKENGGGDTGEVTKAAWEFRQTLATVRRVMSSDPEITGGDDEGAAPAPQPWANREYTGTSGGAAVIELLTTVAADFSTMESDARADETTQQDLYDEWLTEASTTKAQKTKDSEVKASRKHRMEEKLQSKNKDHDHNAKELEATNTYELNLQKACVDGDSTYADRKAARTQEAEALRTAQGILEEAFKNPPAAEDAADAEDTES